MLSGLVRKQLVVFAVIGVLAIVFAAVRYVDLPRVLGAGHYTVTAQFNDISGLYPRAIVTYRGADIGQVRSIHLAPDGTEVSLSLSTSSKIPRNVIASIHSTSAIGEQYVDLVPRQDGGPYLDDGSVISVADTREMPQIAPVLDSLNRTLASVPRDRLTRVLEEADTGLAGSGPDLAQLLGDANALADDANTYVEQTTSLIDQASPFLSTQADLAEEQTAALASLSVATRQLQASDPDLRRLLATIPAAAGTVDDLVRGITPTLPTLLANLTAPAEVLNVYLPNLKQSLVVYPVMMAAVQGALGPHAEDGEVKLDLRTNVNNPPSCTDGFLPESKRRPPSDHSRRSTPVGLHCVADNTTEGVRGARFSPCPNDPSKRASTPAGCGLRFGGAAAAPRSQSAAETSSGAQGVAAYNPLTGLLQAPEGGAYRVGKAFSIPPGSPWTRLLLPEEK
ncbi:MCE family protein [Nocardioides sp. NPDC087217]|uniref:MCE family protein n=1 Tax=Nocardioides sp. NPDC087217 TaxID=3364335 RepID=UPI0037FBF373